MAPIPIAAAILVLLGAAAALRATHGRLTVVGLGVALLGLPLAVGGIPDPLLLAFRTVAVLLALLLLDHAVRRTTSLIGPIRLGGTTEMAIVLAAWLLGLLLGSTMPDARGSAVALATAVALGTAGLTLLCFGHDTLRLGIGAMLALAAGATAVPAFGGGERAALELALAGALLAVAGATTWLAVVGGRVRHDLELADRPRDLRDAG